MFFIREEVEEFFNSMDRDFDGRLSFEEFMGEESQIEKLFKNMDKNGDGLVTKQVSRGRRGGFVEATLSISDQTEIFIIEGIYDNLQKSDR